MEGPQFRDAVLTRDGTVDYAAFNAIWPNLRVLARCSPKDKYTIVRGEAWGQGWCPYREALWRSAVRSGPWCQSSAKHGFHPCSSKNEGDRFQLSPCPPLSACSSSTVQ